MRKVVVIRIHHHMLVISENLVVFTGYVSEERGKGSLAISYRSYVPMYHHDLGGVSAISR